MIFSLHREDFASLQAEWLDILPTSSANTIFATPDWQTIWWEHFAGERELHLLSLRHERKLAGILPLARLGDTMYLIGDVDVCDYMDLVLPPEHESAALAHLLDYLDRSDVRHLELRSVPSASPTLRYLPSLAAERGYQVNLEVEESCPQVALPPTWEGYLASLNKKDRHELRRKMRRAEESGPLRHYPVNGGENIPRDMEQFFHLQTISHQGKESFMTRQRRDFFLALAGQFIPRGMLRLYFLEADGTRTAGTLCFDYGNRFMLYNSGYDPAFAAHSMSLVLKALCLRDAIELGRQSFDFLRGREPYKYHLGGVDHAVCRLSIRR
ncbi:MAG: GNAT family N-acetyltransferase [Chloroflexota bacterium]|nr:MAG: GNAT family N-acetyltransferase [Chloroflexota bacterium]